MLYIAYAESNGQNRLTFEQVSGLLNAGGVEHELSYFDSLHTAL